jgi:hypothetical protein
MNSFNMWKVRVPVGKLILELPAGMLDDDQGDFVGTAVREVICFDKLLQDCNSSTCRTIINSLS